MKSYTNGEFHVTHKTVEGNYIVTRTYVFGGVDFTSSPTSDVSAGAFASKWAGLPSRVAGSQANAVRHQNSDDVRRGGGAAPDPESTFAVTHRTGRDWGRALLIVEPTWIVLGLASLLLIPIGRRRRRRARRSLG